PQHNLGRAFLYRPGQPVAECLIASRANHHRTDAHLARPGAAVAGTLLLRRTEGRYLTAFLSAAPAVNFGTREAAIWILSPVAGLRPSRALRCETLNLPKPENVTSLPRFRADSIVSSIASTASPASFLLNPARSATWSTNSDFVTCSSF